MNTPNFINELRKLVYTREGLLVALEKHMAASEALATEITGIEEIDIPQLFEDAGQGPKAKIDIGGGRTVGITKRYFGNTSAATVSPAAAYLTARQSGGLVKRTVEVQFGFDKADDAADFARSTREVQDAAVKEKMTINAQSLSKWVRERMEAGEEVPDSIKYHVRRKAKISE